MPTVGGNKELHYPLAVGNVYGNLVNGINFMDDAELGLENKLPVSGGIVRITVEEKPILILYKQMQ
jgi:hypothetical protein